MAAPEDSRAMWISWERHRRSTELADALDIPLVTMVSSLPYYLRAAHLGLRTKWLLLTSRPRVLVIQNPSIVLATLACLMRPLLGYRLVVDRHSNFTPRGSRISRPERFLFGLLSRYTLRTADLTVVTNESLRRLVHQEGGRGLVLQDRPPRLDLARPRNLGPGRHLVFVATFSPDEPVSAVLTAAQRLPDGVTVHITGDTGRAAPDLVAQAPPNVRFTGFLPEPDYQSLLAAADGVLALTTCPDTLLCCAYEAVALGRPLVLSDHAALTAYFDRGAVTTDNSAASLATAMIQLLDEQERLEEEIRDLADVHALDWNQRFKDLRTFVADG